MPRRVADDRMKLLHDPYRAPGLHVGDRAQCLYRDCLVEVTGWTDARISWLRALPVGERGHPSLLVDAELARAIRTEAAVAVRFWWGVSGLVIWKWRRALGVTRTDNPDSRRVIRLAAQAGGQANQRHAAERGLPLHKLHDLPLSLPKMPSWQALDRQDRLAVRSPKRIDVNSTVRRPARGRTRA
jgi:hypothetical protein